MLDAIFYDKKNHREVKLSELGTTRIGNAIVTHDEDQPSPKRKADLSLIIFTEEIKDQLCYKTEDCPEFCNWDMHLDQNDLIFLRIEDNES